MPPTLYQKLKRKAVHSEKLLRKHHPKAVAFLEKSGIQPGKIREHAAKTIVSGALTGALMLATPILGQTLPNINAKYITLTNQERQNMLTKELQPILPQAVGLKLDSEKEKNISRIIADLWGINAVAELDGNRLNHDYGYIGAEQHLPRFPGDHISLHDEYQQSGITPGKGAWGYFAYSQNQLTNDLIQKEKYYIAVQTLYLPDWQTNLPYLREWYKYRKVLVINPVNGKTIVADIADSGPASFTGKHFGGSPEVMAYLGLNVGMQKGPVILFFVDDPENQIPLGPVEYNRPKYG